jgi:hypothetical protein
MRTAEEALFEVGKMLNRNERPEVDRDEAKKALTEHTFAVLAGLPAKPLTADQEAELSLCEDPKQDLIPSSLARAFKIEREHYADFMGTALQSFFWPVPSASDSENRETA